MSAVIEPDSVADRRLRDDLYAWLTTIHKDLQPHSSLVFFFWDGSDVLVYTIPDRPKVRNIEAHPKVSINLNAESDGGGVVTLAGEAQLRYDAPTAEGYLEKYSDRLSGFGLSPDEFTRPVLGRDKDHASPSQSLVARPPISRCFLRTMWSRLPAACAIRASRELLEKTLDLESA